MDSYLALNITNYFIINNSINFHIWGEIYMEDKIIKAAMEILIHAGDARLANNEALIAIANQNFDKIDEKMEMAQAEIMAAHHIHTDIIQKDSAGEGKMEYSLLFSHAEDTLMTVSSEINITKQLIKIFKSYEKRISALEEFVGKINIRENE